MDKCVKCGAALSPGAAFCGNCGTKTAQSQPINEEILHDISAVWPEWKLEKRIGKGSYGIVYKASRNDNGITCNAAIKIISIPADSSEVETLRADGLDVDGTKTFFKNIVDDFVTEIQLMESLKGVQNIVSVEDYKVIEKTNTVGYDIYIRMELLTPFNTYLKDRVMTEQEVIGLGNDICTALEICGQRNVIHRDIKPENIFVNDFGYFKLGDFGIARKLENMTGGLSQKGTPNYMAPEVINGGRYDSRADVYSLGIVLYRLMNDNRLPFLDNEKQLLSPTERKNAIDRRINGEALPAPCKASPAMANLILRASAFEPDARFSTATEMKQALAAVANGTYSIVDLETDKTMPIGNLNVMREAGQQNNDVRMDNGIDNKRTKTTNTVNNFDGKPKKKRKKGKFIAIAVLVLVIALAVTLTVEFFTSSAYKVYGYIDDGEFKAALAEYNAGVKDSFIQEKLLDVLIGDRADEVTERYENDEIGYTAAIDELAMLEQMKVDKVDSARTTVMQSYADEVVANYQSGKLDYNSAIIEFQVLEDDGYSVEEVNNVRVTVMQAYAGTVVGAYESGEMDYDAAIAQLQVLKNDGYADADSLIKKAEEENDADNTFKQAEKYYENGDYANAIAAYSKIPESNDNYDEAQNMLSRVYSDYIESTLASADKSYGSGDYKQAIRLVDAVCDVLPSCVDTSELITAREKNLAAYKAAVASEVNDYIDSSQWAESFTLIDQAISFDDNDYFEDLKDTTESKYIKFVTDKVDACLESEDYLSAARVASNALEILPGNAELKSLKSKVEKLTPVYFLDKYKPYSSDVYEEFVNGESFVMSGTSYTNGFVLNHHGGFALYNLTDSSYNTLSFTLGHRDGSRNENMTLKIYFDNVLVKEIAVDWEALPERITLDITGVKQIKFEAVDGYAVIGLANITIK